LKSEAKQSAKCKDGFCADVKSSQAVEAGSQAESSEVAAGRMWEDISGTSEISDCVSSYSDLSPLPATTRVTVVGNGLIQVSTADPIMRRLSLGSDDAKMSMGLNWKTSKDMVFCYEYCGLSCKYV